MKVHEYALEKGIEQVGKDIEAIQKVMSQGNKTTEEIIMEIFPDVTDEVRYKISILCMLF